MRLRHIEQAWEGVRHLENLNVYLQNVAVHVPRLRHLLWNGYVREASEAVKQMLAQFDQHTNFRETPAKSGTYTSWSTILAPTWGRTQLRSSTTVGDTGPVSRYPVRRLKAANSLVNARMNRKRQCVGLRSALIGFCKSEPLSRTVVSKGKARPSSLTPSFFLLSMVAGQRLTPA